MSKYLTNYGPSAIVTGASSGIGKSLAQQVAAAGMYVIVVARRTELLAELKSEIEQSHGIQCELLTADLATPEGVSKVAALSEQHDIGLVINNAGINLPLDYFDQQDVNRLQTMLDLHVSATMRITHHYLGIFRARDRGAIINVASTGAFQPVPLMANYAATKAYMLSLGAAICNELRGSNVDLLTLCPGSTDTEINAHAGMDTDKIRSISMTPDRVAEIALASLGKKDSVVTGFANKLGAHVAPRLFSRKFVAGVVRRVMERIPRAS